MELGIGRLLAWLIIAQELPLPSFLVPSHYRQQGTGRNVSISVYQGKWKNELDFRKHVRLRILVFRTCHHAAACPSLFCCTACIISVRWLSSIFHFLFLLQAAVLFMCCCAKEFLRVLLSLVWSEWTHHYYHNGWQHHWTLRAIDHCGAVPNVNFF